MLSVLFIHSIMHLCDAKIVERLISSWQISENSQILEESKYRKVIFFGSNSGNRSEYSRPANSHPCVDKTLWAKNKDFPNLGV